MSELKTEAWLVDNYKGGFGDEEKHEFSVVMSPLTDDTYMDEGDEAHALCRLEVAQGIIAGLSAALTAEARQHDATRKRLASLSKAEPVGYLRITRAKSYPDHKDFATAPWLPDQKAYYSRDPDHSCEEIPLYASPPPAPEAVRLLRGALEALYKETADYIRINNLGVIHHNRSMQMARDALLATKSPS